MFRGAVRADMARILDIYARAREFMAKNGNSTQWGDNYPSPELLEEDIDTNRLFVYMVNGRMQAVFAFVLGEDPTYKVIEDGQWLNDTLPYGTLHRLASAGESKGIGKAVVEWCLEHCESLRADTHEDNQIMQHLLCTVCRSLHRHHSGIVLTGIRLYQRAINKTTHYVRNQIIQQCLYRRVKHHLIIVALQIFVKILFSVQWKDLEHIRFHLEGIDHFCIDNVNLIQFP